MRKVCLYLMVFVQLLSLSIADSGLVLWNKLGSAEEFSNSGVGNNLIPPVTPVSDIFNYDGMYGKGYYTGTYPGGTDVNSAAWKASGTIPPNTIPAYEGCIEFWYKRTGAIVEYNGFLGYPDRTTYTSHAFLQFQTLGVVGVYAHVFHNGGAWKRQVTWRMSLADLTKYFPVNENVHIALVWSDSLLTGSSYLRVYRNGVPIDSDPLITITATDITNTGAPGGESTLTQHTRLGVGSYACGARGPMDNLKVWNYAKTDFSDCFDEGAGASGAPAYGFSKNGDIVTYKHQSSNYQEIASIKLSESLVNMGTLTSTNFSNVIMEKTADGKPKLDIPSVNGSIAAAVNNSNGTKWVTANFAVSKLQPIFLNGEQITDDQGKVFPQFLSPIKYVDNVTFNAGVMTFRIYHFSEWLIPDMTGKAFTGTQDDDSIVANGSSIEVLAGGLSQDTGDGGQTATTGVAKISGLAYETVLNDVQKIGDIYKPMDPSDIDYSVHFGYINRGNATDNFGIVAEMVSDNAGHFGYTIAVDNKDVAPWQIVSFSIDVNNAAALAYERATLNVTVNVVGDAVSYNAFAGAISTTFGEDGVYGGLDDLSYAFTFETEGYSLKVLNRVATINSPLSDGQFIPGAKVKYEIVIKNESAAVATDVRIKDVIPANTHLYYLDGVTENQNVVGALNDVWTILSVTDNAADDVEYQFSIPANETVTASYTVTVD